MANRRITPILALQLAAGIALAGPAAAADHFVAYNLTSSTPITGLALAPAGTQDWGPDQVLNDPDKVLDTSERLKLRGIARGRYDVRLTFGKGQACVKHGIDLTHDQSFDIRDADLAACK